MSAWIVSKAHIDALVTALTESELVVDVEPDEIGRTLWRENLASIQYRYPSDRDGDYPGPVSFRESDVESYTFIPLRLSKEWYLQSAECYDYQSCEHPGCRDTTALRWIDSLVERLRATGIQAEGPWGIEEEHRTVADAVA